MKSVLISIRPEWCEKIASGEKTVEIRKTAPKLEPPFKVYVYQTKHREHNGPTHSDGKVIGEFTCSEIFPIRVFENGSIQDYMCHYMERSLVPYDDIAAYIGKDKTGYGWRIADLVIYERPKLLGWFQKPCICKGEYDGEEYRDCLNCELAGDSDYGIIACNRPIKRPPQSWCYVEEFDT
jgi:predicted transcriptional regulator